MVKHSTGLASALATATAALLIAAPIASADDPPPCAPDDQQCQEQQKNPGAGIADQVVDNVQQGLDAAKKVYSDGNTSGPGWQTLLDGIPYCMHMGAQVKPGVVVQNVDPSGVAHPC
jgi:hypothetical protein